MKNLNILFYVLITIIVILIILLILVQFNFRDFVKDLEDTNLYLYQEEGTILYGFESIPYHPLSEEDLIELNAEAREEWDDFPNIFVFTRAALEAKDIGEVEFVERIYSKEEAIKLLDSTELTLASKTNVFSSMVENYESEYIFDQFKKDNIFIYPHRLLWKFVDCCPASLTKFLSFKREVGV